MGTCASQKGFSTIDFFVVHKDLAACIKQVLVLEDTPSRTHRPVNLVFHPQMVDLYMMEFKEMEALPKQRVIGPLQLLPDQHKILKMAWEALAAARAGSTQAEGGGNRPGLCWLG